MILEIFSNLNISMTLLKFYEGLWNFEGQLCIEMLIGEYLFSTSESESGLYLKVQRLSLYKCLKGAHVTMTSLILWKHW